jgi:hypothetical protein
VFNQSQQGRQDGADYIIVNRQQREKSRLRAEGGIPFKRHTPNNLLPPAKPHLPKFPQPPKIPFSFSF